MKLMRRGFTIIEITIVGAILAIVTAIAIPNMIKARTASQEKVCHANARQLQTALDTAALSDNSVTTLGLSEDQIITLVQAEYVKSIPHCSGGHYYTDDNGNVMCDYHNRRQLTLTAMPFLGKSPTKTGQ